MARREGCLVEAERKGTREILSSRRRLCKRFLTHGGHPGELALVGDQLCTLARERLAHVHTVPPAALLQERDILVVADCAPEGDGGLLACLVWDSLAVDVAFRAAAQCGGGAGTIRPYGKGRAVARNALPSLHAHQRTPRTAHRMTQPRAHVHDNTKEIINCGSSRGQHGKHPDALCSVCCSSHTHTHIQNEGNPAAQRPTPTPASYAVTTGDCTSTFLSTHTV